MPTVVTAGAFRILILNPPREHGPAHVHVLKGKGAGEGEVLVNLGEAADAPWGPVNIREVKGMQTRDVVRAVRLVEDNLALLRGRWTEMHGNG